ncbi:hypothetical protein [Clostridium chromiireducens]|uniref:Uncharacterized protein n=1 Tax=Clostridium chromiireducens TaxID=225345 RepID=A0A1V4IGY7_9CLOT|nr:hypothetical protein [Clostridium chromiireducens]OPJ59252.1 hypothetical protein CLCHR_35650 [Clostridium chromiireducens]
MKRFYIIAILILLLILNIIFISTTMHYKDKINKETFKVYLFEGENNNIKINDGIIIISPNKQILNGGKIQYVGNKQENITSYSKKIYMNTQETNKDILYNSVSSQGNGNGTTFPDEFLLNRDIGEISSKKLFSEEDMANIKDNLYFCLNYSVNGQETESTVIKLNVKEFDMKEDK